MMGGFQDVAANVRRFVQDLPFRVGADIGRQEEGRRSVDDLQDQRPVVIGGAPDG